jgi:hypothetical protein
MKFTKTRNGLFTNICTKIASVAVLQHIKFLQGNPINHIKFAMAIELDNNNCYNNPINEISRAQAQGKLSTVNCQLLTCN